MTTKVCCRVMLLLTSLVLAPACSDGETDPRSPVEAGSDAAADAPSEAEFDAGEDADLIEDAATEAE